MNIIIIGAADGGEIPALDRPIGSWNNKIREILRKTLTRVSPCA
jgi:hypothetical protein